jgi:hypothetical protein
MDADSVHQLHVQKTSTYEVHEDGEDKRLKRVGIRLKKWLV